jgi:hypothetical protein
MFSPIDNGTKIKYASWLRSWVQIPPGPLFTALEIRYCFEIDFNDCRTKLAAMPMPYPPICPTKVKIFARSVGQSPLHFDNPKSVSDTISNLLHLIKLPTNSAFIMP